jgi:hypothetical protein
LRANDEQQLHHHNIQKLGKSSLPTQQLLLTTPDKVASHHMPTVLDSDKTSYTLILSHSLSLSVSRIVTTTHSHLIMRELSSQQQPQLRTRKVQSIFFFLCRNPFFSQKREQHDGWHTNLGTNRQSSRKKTNKH